MLFMYVLIALVVLMQVVLVFLVLRAGKPASDPVLLGNVERISRDMLRLEGLMKEEGKSGREEAATLSRANREEIAGAVRLLGDSLGRSLSEAFLQQKHLLETFATSLEKLTKSNEVQFQGLIKNLETQLLELRNAHNENNALARRELKENLEQFRSEIQTSLNAYRDAQRENFDSFRELQKVQANTHTEKLSDMRLTMERSIGALQEGNEKKLEEMRNTVDEKLQKTLETRLSESFKQVSTHLEAVQKGLGEMQQLATGVGDLKKVLSNVKTRGVLGEYQLENILEQMLTPEQYGKNVKTKAGSNALVEFAIRLPGKNNSENPLWIPVDAKFPREDYELLQEAYERADVDVIEESRKNFARGLRRFANDIQTKYIDPPNTTDFAILFLPFESLYAEALRMPGLFESIQREQKVIITGPTTLSAILTSLQMGFRTLAIEKRSGEVWDVLGMVKKEFKDFGTLIGKTEKKLQEATNIIKQVSVRNRALDRSLKSVEELPPEKRDKLLEEFNLNNTDPEAGTLEDTCEETPE